MNRNLENVCRVCLSSGSRNIFEKVSTVDDIAVPLMDENVSSLDRLPEKLRYVTMLKVDECENLPKRLCDSCIIQLNVAYNLKKSAIQSDMKLRQYMIEYGMNVTSYTTCSINTVSVIGAPPALLTPPNRSSTSMTITTANSTNINTILSPPPPLPIARKSAVPTVAATVLPAAAAAAVQPPPPPQQQQQQQPSPSDRPFSVMPIKEEPIDFEDISDVTVETNTEALGNRSNERRVHFAQLPFNPRHSLQPNAVVAINTRELRMGGNGTDGEYISAYISPSGVKRDGSYVYRVARQKVRPSTSSSQTTSSAEKDTSPRSGRSSRSNTTSESSTPKPSSTPKTSSTPKPSSTPKTSSAPKPSSAPKTAQTPRPPTTNGQLSNDEETVRSIRTRRQSTITRSPETPTRRLRERTEISYFETAKHPTPVQKAVAKSVRAAERPAKSVKGRRQQIIPYTMRRSIPQTQNHR